MSDEEEITYIKRTKTVHYGSLEEEERRRLQMESRKGEDDNYASSSKLSTQQGGNINVSDQYMDLEADMNKDRQALLEEFERRKRARQINVSTDDQEVKKNLRQLGEPVCLFGEGPADRRNRLRDFLSKFGEEAIMRKLDEEGERVQAEKEQETTWYHEGPETLKTARLWIAEYSLRRSQKRLVKLRQQKETSEALRTAHRQELQKQLQSVGIICSQVGDTRPVSFCMFSPDSKMLATGSWSGLCKLWSVPDCKPIRTLKGHKAHIGGIVFHPQATIGLDEKECCMASCSADGTVKLWNLVSEEPVADFEGHAPYRVSRLAYHPSGRFLGTCCFDKSWRLWDLEQQCEVLHQEGHNGSVYCLSFQCDGSLVATGGLDSYGRLWDLRSGRCMMFLDGHHGSVLSIDFNPNGYQLATGSEDNSCKVWDVRHRKCIYTIPCHTNIVSGVKHQSDKGQYLVTASYDGKARIWSHRSWQPLKTMAGHDSKIMGLDISPDGKYISTSSFDRTFKLWAPE